MKLELKHIVPYLPHEVYAYCEAQENKIDKIVGVYQDTIDFENWSPINSDIENYKLVLLPISCIAEEIEHNGERFVPVDKLGWNAYGFVIEQGHCTGVAYSSVCKLAEWHIDFQGLIPAGLAVDKREAK